MLKLWTDIVRTLKESDVKSNFVAIGNLLSGNKSKHAGFVIQYNNKLTEYHYTGREIELCDVYNDYFHKRTEVIHSDEVPSFIAHCMKIKEKASPKYDFFYSGEYFDINGNHISSNSFGERMTCVGFCLNVLKGFLEEDYIEYQDWDENSNELNEYIEMYCTTNDLEIEKISGHHRRITPREILISAFFNDLPIRKENIDNKKKEIANYFEFVK